jgi:4-hydroxy-tetrahydrodipicolinate synthase
MDNQFGTLITAMATPFAESGELDIRAAQQLAGHLFENGHDALILFGSTGEAATMSPDEKLELLRAVREAVGPYRPLICGTGTNNTKQSAEFSIACREAGADGIMLVVPYYNKPTQDGIVAHFDYISGQAQLPTIIYNIPGRTGTLASPDTILRCAQNPNIVALKDATQNCDNVTEIAAKAPPGFVVYSGDDSLTLPYLACGAYGVISVAGHICGPEIKEMIDSFQSGNTQRALLLHRIVFPVVKALFCVTNPIPLKEALKQRGLCSNAVRLPLLPADSKVAQQVAEALCAFDARKVTA